MKYKGMGWSPDRPDIRDFNMSNKAISDLLDKTKMSKVINNLPKSVDLKEWCSPVEDQGQLGSCTAQSGVALLEYLERKTTGEHIDASRLFLYKVTRNMMGLTGDTGAWLRDTMKAMSMVGVLPEKYYEYDVDEFDEEPKAFHYALAQNFQAVKYYRLDSNSTTSSNIIPLIKSHLAVGIPFMFGFMVYDSIDSANDSGEIPFPEMTDRSAGGHAVVGVGYDDDKEITHPTSGNKTKGAILIKNSWSTYWGDEGYGWIPYDYFTYGLAIDLWVLISSEFIDTGVFNP